MLTITGCDVRFLAIRLDTPFVLGFGSLSTLPRVLIRLTGEKNGRTYEGVGEAAIDFPFVAYDMWDVFHALQQLDLTQHVYPEISPFDMLTENNHRRQEGKLLLPPPLPFRHQEIEQLARFPSGLAAITMACDDLWGRAHGISLSELATGENSGHAMVSLGFNDPDTVVNNVVSLLDRGLIPKIKLGRSIPEDVNTLALVELALDRRRAKSIVTADVNGSYTLDDMSEFIQLAKQRGLSLRHLVALEQPVASTTPLSAYATIGERLAKALGWFGTLVADESVVTIEDASHCAAIGWAVNYKVQKIGGLRQALAIAEATRFAPGMVGGTFPTAIGRAYDLWVASTLVNATLPSDAWEPSTDWFAGPRHLITESFIVDDENKTHTFTGQGLGVTVDWEKVSQFVISDPASAYRALRSDQSPTQLHITLRPGQSYAGLYRQKTGRSPDWNL